jgi:hypothetical protein
VSLFQARRSCSVCRVSGRWLSSSLNAASSALIKALQHHIEGRKSADGYSGVLQFLHEIIGGSGESVN